MGRPLLMTFDFFGTVLDWRRGIREALGVHGVELDEAAFERVIDLQGELEQRAFRPYREIVAESLERGVGLDARAARELGERAGTWPLYPDSRDALRKLVGLTKCAAMTNSDVAHGRDVRAQLGFELQGWICAEEIGVYKPGPEFWKKTSEKMGIAPGKDWWHVSAYADYDLEPARAFGLTTVFVNRPHARPGPADISVENLEELVSRGWL